MGSVPVVLDDELDAALEAVSAEQGRSKADLVSDILRRYVETERLTRSLQDPELVGLYQQLAAEDQALAEEGLTEYQQSLAAADQR
jgi:plasmid stability protein